MFGAAMRVDLSFGGLAAGARGMAVLAQRMERAADAQDRLQESAARGARSGGGAGGGMRRAAGFISGPNQRLAQIREQMERAQREGNSAALEDLQIAQFNALRQRSQAHKRMSKGVDAPGLLELFGDLRGVARGITSGNPLAAVRSLPRGLQLGGLNAAQKAASGAGAMRAVQALMPLAPAAVKATGALGGAAGAVAGLSTAAAAAAGPLTALVVVAGSVVAGMKAVFDAAQQAAEQLGAIRAAQTVSGGTGKEIAALQALGVDPSQIPGLAAGLRAKIEAGGDPFGMMAAQRLGIGNPLPARFGGPTNNAQFLARAFEELRKKDPTERLRLAGMLGMEDQLPLLDVSERTARAQTRDQDLMARISGGDAGRQANDFNAALERVGRNWSAVTTALGKGAMAPITEGLHNVADALGGIAEWVNANPQAAEFLGKLVKAGLDFTAWIIRSAPAILNGLSLMSPALGAIKLALTHGADAMNLLERLTGGFMGFLRQAYEAIRSLPIPGLKNLLPALPADQKAPKADKRQSAIDRHTKALEDHAQALREGTFGGGERARGALPGGLRGPDFHRQAIGGALRLGAFVL